MEAGGSRGPDKATKEQLLANTQRLLCNKVNKVRQKEMQKNKLY